MLRPVFEYPVDEYINQLQPYKNRPGLQRLLELPRKIWKSNAYIYHSQAVPRGGAADLLFTAYQTRDFAMTVPPGSYCTMIGRWYDQDEGYKFNVSDKGGKVYLVDNDLMLGNLGGGEFIADATNPPVQTGSAPFGLRMLDSPFIVCEPGQLTIEITSLSASEQNLQLYMAFAVPISNQTLNTPVYRSV